jgi:HlyD family secretion protein
MAKKFKSNKKLIWGAIALIAVLLVFAVMKGKGEKVGEKVYAEKVIKRTIMETVSASGRIYPEKEVKISSDVSGQIVELLVREGDSVRVGQLLARVNPEIYKDQVERGEAGVNASKAQYLNAQAQLQSIESRKVQAAAQKDQIAAQLANTRSSYDRNDKLHKDGVISDSEFEQSQATLRQNEANLRSSEASVQSSIADLEGSRQALEAQGYNVKSSEASLKELKTSLNKTSIYSPVDGIVTKLSIQKGERVVGTAQMSGTEIMRIANMNSMEVRVDVSENDIVKVATGNEVEIDVDAFSGRKFKGTVSEIANTASNAFTAAGLPNLSTDQVTNFEIKIRIDAKSYSDLVRGGRSPFHPGLSASVNIRTNTVADASSVQVAAVTTREDIDETARKIKEAAKDENEQKKVDKKAVIKEVVFIVSGDTAKMVEVKSGIQDNKYIQIISGLKEGDEVIAEPYNAISKKLKNGMKIVKVTKEVLYKTQDKK